MALTFYLRISKIGRARWRAPVNWMKDELIDEHSKADIANPELTDIDQST